MVSARPLMDIELKTDAVVLTATRGLSEFDYDDLEQEGKAIARMLETMARPAVVIDLSRAEYVTSSVITLFLRLSRSSPGRLALCALSDSATDILRVTRLEKMWPIYASKQEALEKTRNPRFSVKSVNFAERSLR